VIRHCCSEDVDRNFELVLGVEVRDVEMNEERDEDDAEEHVH